MQWQNFKGESNQFQIEGNEVHIWLIPFDKIINEISFFEDLLSQNELSRAGRFYFEMDKNKFIVGRGILRLIISKYSGIFPSQINFIYNEFGKPSLEKGQNSMFLEFNTSHSASFVTIGITIVAQIGIDIENLERKSDLLELAKRYFAEGEYTKLSSLPKELLTEGFYNCWTRKEAFIKALGNGLSYPLDTFEVTLAPYEETRFSKIAGGNVDEWKLINIKPPSKYVGAIAINRKSNELKYWYLDDYRVLLN